MEFILTCAQAAALITNISLYQPMNYQPILKSEVYQNTPADCRIPGKNANAD